MSLTDEQKHQVAAWIEEGLKPADIQIRLESEFDLRVTYMDVRFLIDDLKLMPKDPEPPAPPEAPPEAPAPTAGEAAPPPAAPAAPAGDPSPLDAAATGGVALKVDSITRPGAMVSGSATFSDGKTAEWHLDQMGRLGMVPPEPGYRPPEKDVAEFQIALEQELAKMGM